MDKKLLFNLNSHTNWVKCTRFDNDSKKIASCGDDKVMKLWDLEKKTLVHNFEHTGMVNSLRFHPDNSLIGTACFDKKLRVNYNKNKKRFLIFEAGKLYNVTKTIQSRLQI